jgi:nucleotidyltransferase substrate binding protein (TIGR01987 family)
MGKSIWFSLSIFIFTLTPMPAAALYAQKRMKISRRRHEVGGEKGQQLIANSQQPIFILTPMPCYGTKPNKNYCQRLMSKVQSLKTTSTSRLLPSAYFYPNIADDYCRCFASSTGRDVIRDSVIQRFEFTYELAWKTTKEYLEGLGIVDRNSPKAVISEAYAQKLIDNEADWLLMLDDRNQTSHVYKAEMAEEIANRILNKYLSEFAKLLAGLRNG